MEHVCLYEIETLNVPRRRRSAIKKTTDGNSVLHSFKVVKTGRTADDYRQSHNVELEACCGFEVMNRGPAVFIKYTDHSDARACIMLTRRREASHLDWSVRSRRKAKSIQTDGNERVEDWIAEHGGQVRQGLFQPWGRRSASLRCDWSAR